MNVIIVKCPECNKAAHWESANFIAISKNDVELFKDIKEVKVKQTKVNHVSKRPFYHAVHYPKIAPDLDNIKKLPEKYSADKWTNGFKTPYQLESYPDSVVRCTSCEYLAVHKFDWPNDAYFQIEIKGQQLWAYDRRTALKLLDYIESKDRRKRFSPDEVAQDYFLRKIPEFFQTSNARPVISKKLRKLLGLPSKKLT